MRSMLVQGVANPCLGRGGQVVARTGRPHSICRRSGAASAAIRGARRCRSEATACDGPGNRDCARLSLARRLRYTQVV